ncbi:uncharacterized protein LOC131874087 [Cryptomeria japonica]|uniref:uncharacterized protein LOC131874087 n=1 Tax=Cryptomeria japonica TaxID=3369 RepID=UPI0027DAABAB|nr:uncharacterized protein LOC131874087 [Cryptomeria japonica]
MEYAEEPVYFMAPRRPFPPRAMQPGFPNEYFPSPRQTFPNSNTWYGGWQQPSSYPQWSQNYQFGTQLWQQAWRPNVPQPPSYPQSYPQPYLPQTQFPPPPLINPYQQPQQFLPPIPSSSSNPIPNPPQPPKPTSMPTQPNPNPNNKPSQPVYNNEVASYPTYSVNTVELEGVQLRSGKALQGPTIIEINEEPKAESEKEPLFPDRLLSKPAIKDILVYNKTVRELCTRRQKKKEDPKTIQVIGQLADLMLGNLTIPKYADLGSPVIQVRIGKITIPNTLVDLGAAINVMTNETKTKLSLEGLRPTPTVLQMADRSLVKPEGVIEDVVLSIDSWDFPTDFMILQPKVKLGGYPLILGGPWLAAANAFINCRSCNMVISNGEQTKQITLYPPAQPLLETEDPIWVDSDLEDSLPVLTIEQAYDFEEPTEDNLLVNFL